MKESTYIELAGLSPFNRFFFRSCYFHQLLACYKYFQVLPEVVIGNYLNLYVEENGKLRTREYQVFDKVTFENLTGIRQIKYLPEKPIRYELINLLKKRLPAIIVVDCFYIPFRADTYQKVHTDHYVTVYGYDEVKGVFIILEHESEKDFRYVRHEFAVGDLEEAFQAGVRCLQPGRDPFVTFEKIHGVDEFYFEKLKVRLKEFAREINSSYRTLRRYFSKRDIYKKISKEYEIVYDNLHWQKLRQMYQMSFIYRKDAVALKKYFSDLIHAYTALSSICLNTEQGAEELKEVFNQIKLICKREKQLKHFMLR